VLRACVKRAVPREGQNVTGEFVHVSRAMHSPVMGRVAERSAVVERVILAPKNQRRDYDVDFDDQAFVQVDEDSRFGKKDCLAVKARRI